jgi:type IV fimbrial biogenesis protein FimT
MRASRVFAARRLRGFTIVELMVTLAVVSILTTLAVPAFRNMIAQSEMRAVSTALSLAMTKARSEATKRSAVITVAPKSTWVQGWTVSAPANVVVADQGPLRGVTLTSPAQVQYLSSGRVRGFNPSTHRFQLTSTRVSSIVRCVSIDVSGAATIGEGACA